MKLKRKEFLYILCDDENATNIFYINNGVVNKQPFKAFDNSGFNPFLEENPIGWKDIEIDFGTSEKYKSLNRSFNIGLTFIGVGAQIIRDRQYNGRGSEETLYLLLLRWDRDDDIYYEEYKGKLDLSTTEDDINGGVQCKIIEGGALAYLNANDNTTYEIKCDDTNPASIQVLLDGMNLYSTYIFNGYGSQLETYTDSGSFTGVDHTYLVLPVVFAKNDGDSEGIVSGQIVQSDRVGGNNTGSAADASAYNYAQDNAGNATLTTEYISNGNVVTGELDYKTIHLGEPTFGAALQDGLEPNLYAFTNIRTERIPLYIGNNNYAPVNQIGIIPFSFNIDLAENERLYFEVDIRTRMQPGIEPLNVIEVQASSFIKFQIISRKSVTNAFSLSWYDYYKQMVLALTEGKYTGESLYLKSRPDLAVTCGDALRNTDRTVIPNYVIAANFSDMFQSVPADKASGSSVGLQVRGNALYLELLSDLYSNTAPVYPLGEINGLKINAATGIICNTIHTGAPDQNYESNDGKFEVNSEQDWQMPVLSQKKVFDISSRFREDARGIEEIRSKFTKLDTTDNAGDKQPWSLSIEQSNLIQKFTADRTTNKNYTGQNWVDYENFNGDYIVTDANKYILTFPAPYQRANLFVYLTFSAAQNREVTVFKNGQSIYDYIGINIYVNTEIDNVAFALNDNIEVQITPLDAGDQDYTIEHATVYYNFLVKPFILYRNPDAAYTGGLDATTFNREFDPRDKIYSHGNEIHEILAQQDAFDITLLSGKKNTSLVTTINGVSVREDDPIPVSSLANPLGLPYDFDFTTQVPYTFSSILQMARTGIFSFTCNGVLLYAQSRGQLKSTPANNAAQEWLLRASSLNLFSDFLRVADNESINFNFINNMVAASIYYCPLHLVKYGFTPQAKYHNIDFTEDWSYHRFAEQQWFNSAYEYAYKQKWQTNDTIPIPLITSGLGQLSIFVYDVNGNLYNTQLMNVITTPYVKLPYTLQQYNLNIADEGLYLIVIKAGTNNIYISEWQDIRTDWSNTLLFNYSHSKNQLNLPWLAYNGQLNIRFNGFLEQWEPDFEAVDYEDEGGDFSIQSGTALIKRNLIIGATEKEPDWMLNKINSILLLDRVFADGETNDESKHVTRRAASQMQVTKYIGNPYLRGDIEIIPATNMNFLQIENVPDNEPSGWHGTFRIQTYGDDEGTTEIQILNG